MKMNILLFFILLFTTSCSTKIRSLNGDWHQVFLGYEDQDEDGFISDSAVISLDLGKNLQIVFDYNDGLDTDYGDSILFKYPQLNFRKQNYNKTYNRYQMQYIEECDCFNGKFKSFNGRSVLVKWVR